jgi:subtilase family serine protease
MLAKFVPTLRRHRNRTRLPQLPGRARPIRPRLEELEARALPSAGGLAEIAAHSQITMTPFAGSTSQPSYYTPSQIRQMYCFTLVANKGAGQTIAVVDAFHDPYITSDLQTFHTSVLGLPGAPAFTVLNLTNGNVDSGWASETALDVEWAHAIAPAAKILLVEARSDRLIDLLNAVNVARYQPGVVAVSMSWGVAEFSTEAQSDSVFTTPSGHTGITFVAASGDDGSGAEWPAASPNVLGVGGTTLNTNSWGNWAGETGWGSSGGGYSQFEGKPAWQSNGQTATHRSTPDVAYDADPNTGVLVYFTDPTNPVTNSGYWIFGGTSAGAPQWAALLALADQGRVAAGKGTLANAQQFLYAMPATDFHDITAGSNGAYHAGTGYDLVTGIGSPRANVLVPALVSVQVSNAAPARGSSATMAAAHASLVPGENIGAVALDLSPALAVSQDMTGLWQTSWAPTYAQTRAVADDAVRDLAAPPLSEFDGLKAHTLARFRVTDEGVHHAGAGEDASGHPRLVLWQEARIGAPAELSCF